MFYINILTTDMALTSNQILFLDYVTKRNWYYTNGKIHDTSKNPIVNVDGNVDMNNDKASMYGFGHVIPVKFGIVTGYFDCHNCDLTTLNNAPKVVRGSFDCSWNKLTTLDDLPEYIGDWLILHDNDFDPTPEFLKKYGTYKADGKQSTLDDLREKFPKYYGLSEDNPVLDGLWEELMNQYIR